MTHTLDFVRTGHDHERVLRVVAGCVNTTSRLPDQVFEIRCERFRLFDFDYILEGQFWSFLESLAVSNGDAAVTLAVLEPQATYFKQFFGYFGEAIIGIGTSEAAYQELIIREPPNSPADALLHNSNILVFCGDSRRWAIWSQRDLGLGVLALTKDFRPLATEACKSIEWLSVSDALETLVAPNFVTTGGTPRDLARRLIKNYNV